MKLLGKDLEFISWIKRDGSGVEAVDERHIYLVRNEFFEINSLSITYKTYIASAFNSFVVKIKPDAIITER